MLASVAAVCSCCLLFVDWRVFVGACSVLCNVRCVVFVVCCLCAVDVLFVVCLLCDCCCVCCCVVWLLVVAFVVGVRCCGLLL